MCIAIAPLLALPATLVPDLSQPAIAGVIAETLTVLGALLICTGLILRTLNFRVKELHSAVTRRSGS